ncbi:hypothetical protein [Microbacterium sp. A1-JK]|uniref:hypothetical protein n=1 Tax=Microbacterium sp. A1-JK TaxID=3177516 RepID=UPI0038868F84
MLRITHPAPALGRQEFLGVDFIDGVAHVDSLHPERELALTQHGATIFEEIEGVKLEDLTKAELSYIAATENVELPAKATKAQMIDALHNAPGIPVLGAGDAVPAPVAAFAEPEGVGETYIPVGPGRLHNQEIIAEISAGVDASEPPAPES